MKINFKKIATVIGSALLVGSSAGFAAAANFPAPFVSSGSADVAVVIGANAALSDAVAATNIGSVLASDLAAGTGSGSTSASVSGEAVTLDSGSTKIYLNTSLNTAKTTLTKSDLPTVLGETTFSGNVDSKITSTITVGSNKVTFAKQPSSNDDPVIGITLNTSSAAPLYNASITMPAVNFTDSDSIGETIHLFGKDYVVSTATSTTSLVLFSSSQEVTLTAGGSNPKSTANVTVNGQSYNVELVTGSSTTSATVAVNGESKQITAGQSKKVGGIDVAVKSTTESSALNTITATLLIGANKLTFTDGTQVTQGSNDDPIDGTTVQLTGTTGALTGLSVAVYAPSSSADAILAGQSFTDPVFGSFKVDFAGLTSPLNDSSRGSVAIKNSGDKGMSLTMTDSDANTKTFDFVYNQSARVVLADSNNYRILVQEKSNLTQNNYTIVGNEDYGHLIQVTRIFNSSSSDPSKDAVTFKDVISGDTYSTDFGATEGSGTVTIDGRQYTVTFQGSGDSGYVWVKNPTSETSSTQLVIFPTIKTNKNTLVSLYEPQNVTLTGLSGLKFPDGDGYTTLGLTYVPEAAYGNWTLDTAATGTIANVTYAGNQTQTITVGQLTYHINSTGTQNVTAITLVKPVIGGEISGPALVLFEGKDTNSYYNAVVTDIESSGASLGSSTNQVGVNTVYLSSSTNYSATLQSDSDITQYVDGYGSLVTKDANTASQAIATISFPSSQVSANVIVGANSASITQGSSGASGTQLGSITVYDSEISAVQGKNLLVIGGSCINAVAAKVLGSNTPVCGADFTAKTGIGDGQYLIQVLASPYTTGKVAMLVSGYNSADTTKAATYLTNNAVTTAVGTKLKGTSVTDATVVTQ